MWKQLRALLPFSQPDRLTISSHGQETCGIPFEQVKEVMKWLGLSLMAAGYEARAHIIWDSPEAGVNLEAVLKDSLRRHEPTFWYRCSDRPIPPQQVLPGDELRSVRAFRVRAISVPVDGKYPPFSKSGSHFEPIAPKSARPAEY